MAFVQRISRRQGPVTNPKSTQDVESSGCSTSTDNSSLQNHSEYSSILVQSTLPVKNFDQEIAPGRRETTASRRRTMALSSDEFTLNKLNTSHLRVYGREEEMKQIEKAVERLYGPGQRDPALLTVRGQSGIGKSALVGQVEHFVRSRGGVFALGKFDLGSRAEPYTAFRTALSSVIDQVVRNRNKDELSEIQQKSKDLLGLDWKVLLDIIPNLNVLLDEILESGDEENVLSPSMEGRQGAVRLRFYFQSFVRLLCSPNHPLVIVLDDVQWTDKPSIELMDAFLCDTELSSALLIVTYRVNEVDDDHQFSTLLKQLRHKQVAVEELVLRGLDMAASNCIVAEALRMEESAATASLAKLVCSKTGGSPFFLVQFLQSLIDEKKLTYNFGNFRWHWKLDEINGMMVTDNVAGLLRDRISKLPHEMQAVLQVASNLGRCFESDDLVHLVTSIASTDLLPLPVDDSEAVVPILEGLVEHGFFERVATKLFFAHDQIQDAASRSVGKELIPSLRYRICKFLLTKSHDSVQGEDELFLTASLCRDAAALVTDPDECLSFASLNLRASQLAMRQSAFDTALQYAETGIAFLGRNKWEACYDLATRLELIAVDAASCNGDFDRMEHYIEDILYRAKSIERRVHVYCTRIRAYCAQERYGEGVDTGLLVLKEVGFRIPARNPSTIAVVCDIIRTKKVMSKHTLASLTSLPIMSDRRHWLALSIIDKMSTLAFYANNKLWLVLWLRAMRLSAKNGLNEFSLVAISTWGVLCRNLFGDVERSIMFADAALALSERIESKVTFPRVSYVVHSYIYHWKNDTRTSIPPIWFGYFKSMEVGDVETAMYNLGETVCLEYVTGSYALDALLVKVEAHISVMGQYNQVSIKNYALCILQTILKLVGKDSDPHLLSGSVMSEEEMHRIAREKGNEHFQAWIASFAMQLAYLFGNYHVAGKNAEISKNFGVTLSQGHYSIPRHFFFYALTSIALVREGVDKRKNMSIASKICKNMKKWQCDGNVNVVHMTSLLDAELAAARGDTATAAVLYRGSIKLAARSGFLNDTALAHEKAMDFYVSSNDTYWAAHHRTEALRCYSEWEAGAKVEQLKRKHEGVVATASAIAPLSSRLATTSMHR